MTFTEHERQLRHLLWLGAPFGQIEEWIDETPVSEEEKSALWLGAWSLTEFVAERRVRCATRRLTKHFRPQRPPPQAHHRVGRTARPTTASADQAPPPAVASRHASVDEPIG
jgi:hypothetical protein